jgi:hypothetical protein
MYAARHLSLHRTSGAQVTFLVVVCAYLAISQEPQAAGMGSDALLDLLNAKGFNPDANGRVHGVMAHILCDRLMQARWRCFCEQIS